MPVYASFFAIIMFASMGLPGLNGFIGEFLILIGAFQVRWWWGALAVTGIVLGAAYMLWLYQRTMFGEITKEENKTLPDLDAREVATLVPIVVFCFWIGLYPAPFLRAMEASVTNVIQVVETGSAGKAVGAKQATGHTSPGTPWVGSPVPGNPATGKPGNSKPQVDRLPNRQVAKSPDRQVFESLDSRIAARGSREER
jgi:formate hydrogenlyase subunit 3/multisubunit Na+/H+ antiporter MnhD subunit